MSRGRPVEGRVKMTVHVLPATRDAIAAQVDKEKPARNTQGKVIDAKFRRKKPEGAK